MTVHFDATPKPEVAGLDVIGPLGPAEPTFYSIFGKRAIDTILVLLAAPIVVPVVLFVALVLALQGQNPFFLQERVGRSGRIFTMVKLRTMVPNAEKALEDLISKDAAARAEWEHDQKLKNDPRVTPFGRFLRKSSFDELPQLWNVLTGDMALVGPRPILPEQRKLYPGSAYYHLRPGITGAWQITDRNHCEFRDRAAFDEQYGQTVSFFTDMKIIANTVAVVLRGTGY